MTDPGNETTSLRDATTSTAVTPHHRRVLMRLTAGRKLLPAALLAAAWSPHLGPRTAALAAAAGISTYVAARSAGKVLRRADQRTLAGRHRRAKLRIHMADLREIRSRGLTFTNVPSLRCAIDDALQAPLNADPDAGAREIRLRRKLTTTGLRQKAELARWLDSPQSLGDALGLLRSDHRSTQAGHPPGPVDVAWIQTGAPRTEISLRVLRHYAPAALWHGQKTVVCAPEEIYHLLRREDTAPSTRTRRREADGGRVADRCVPLDGTEPETVTALYDPDPESPYSRLDELIAAAKLLQH